MTKGKMVVSKRFLKTRLNKEFFDLLVHYHSTELASKLANQMVDEVFEMFNVPDTVEISDD